MMIITINYEALNFVSMMDSHSEMTAATSFVLLERFQEDQRDQNRFIHFYEASHSALLQASHFGTIEDLSFVHFPRHSHVPYV